MVFAGRRRAGDDNDILFESGMMNDLVVCSAECFPMGRGFYFSGDFAV